MVDGSTDVQWMPIPGYKGLYEASSVGDVRSIRRRIYHIDGRSRTMGSTILKQGLGTNGYFGVVLSKNGATKSHSVHRLVLLAFAGSPLKDQEACHINGNRLDNRACNLRWDTRKANHADKLLHNTSLRGESNPMRKLTSDLVLQIRSSVLTHTELARIHGVAVSTISNIRNRKSWTWL